MTAAVGPQFSALKWPVLIWSMTTSFPVEGVEPTVRGTPRAAMVLAPARPSATSFFDVWKVFTAETVTLP
jgi:hypothetical protein